MNAPGPAGEGVDEVDPRFDPRFQRGWEGRTEAPDAPHETAPERPLPMRRAAEGTGSVERTGSLAPPAADAARARPEQRADVVGTALHGSRADGAHPDDALGAEVQEPAPRRRPGLWIALLGIVSAAAVVAGGVGVVLLSTQPPLRLALAATSASAARQLALELISGPVLTVGLVGVAVALALLVSGRRRVDDPDTDAESDSGATDRDGLAMDAVGDDPGEEPVLRPSPAWTTAPADPPAPPAAVPVERIDESLFRPPGSAPVDARRRTSSDPDRFRRHASASAPDERPDDDSRFRP